MAPLLAVGLPILAAWVWLRLVRPLSSLERLCSAIGLGLGCASATFFLWRLGGGAPHIYRIVDPLVWTSLALAGLYRYRRQPRYLPPERSLTPAAVLLAALASAVFLLCGPDVLGRLSVNPQGEWDAWSIWNLRARFLASPGPDWRNAFDVALLWAHPDYPLFLPATTARGWVLTGDIAPIVPASVAVLLTLATVAAVCGSLWSRRDAAAAAMGLSLATVPLFVLLGTSQLADIAVGMFTVLSVVLLAVTPATAVTLALAGAAMGFAAWSKNEGLVVASVLPTCYVLARLKHNGLSAAFQAAIDIIVGLGPVLVVVAVFKLYLAPDNDLVSGVFAPGSLGYWGDLVRVRFVAFYMLREAFEWGGWPFAGPLWLIVLIRFVPRTTSRVADPLVAAVGWLLFIQVTTFFVLYVMSPHMVAWHLQTSWARLIAQIWPTLVWWVCARRRLAGPAPGAGVKRLQS